MTIVSSMTSVFSEVFTWLQTALNTVLSIFYADNDLTVLGVLLVVSLAISIFFLICGYISNLMHFRG